VHFTKYHGCGNDFVVVDLRDAARDDARAVQEPDAVRAICDRNFGVGADGVLAILPPNDAGADARMRVLNADGSEAEMCGNGIRCVAIELRDRGVHKPIVAIDTGAGRLACEIDRVGEVTVAMGAPRLRRGDIPMRGPADERCVDEPLEVDGRTLRVTCVSMGNPHAVAFVSSRDEARLLAETRGPLVEHHAWFPQRTNAEFAAVRSRRELDLVVWERGVGITLACGTGACATVVAGIVTGRCDADAEVRVHLPGGTLAIAVDAALASVRMRGPAARVFSGELDPRRIAPRPT
jgi:diaminopimelate epimerase